MSRIIILLLTCLLGVFEFSCKEEKSIAKVQVDDFEFNIKSAGLGYHVSADNAIDSSRGLTYIVSFTIANTGKSTQSFNERNFRLLDIDGTSVPASVIDNGPHGPINVNALKTEIEPGETELMVSYYRVTGPGTYNFEFTSPQSGNRKMLRLSSL